MLIIRPALERSEQLSMASMRGGVVAKVVILGGQERPPGISVVATDG